MIKKTSVTIISTNLNKNVLKRFQDYELVDSNFNLHSLKNKVIFYKILDNLSDKKLEEIIKYLKMNKINYVIVTNNIELVLYSYYLIIYDRDKILAEGKTEDLLKEEKLWKRLGFKMPFIIELSTYLKNYGLIDKIYYNKESLVKEVWK